MYTTMHEASDSDVVFAALVIYIISYKGIQGSSYLRSTPLQST